MEHFLDPTEMKEVTGKRSSFSNHLIQDFNTSLKLTLLVTIPLEQNIAFLYRRVKNGHKQQLKVVLIQDSSMGRQNGE